MTVAVISYNRSSSESVVVRLLSNLLLAFHEQNSGRLKHRSLSSVAFLLLSSQAKVNGVRQELTDMLFALLAYCVAADTINNNYITNLIRTAHNM